MRNRQFFLWLFGLLASSVGTLYAQAFYNGDGQRIARKLDANHYEVTGSVYTLRNGELIFTFDGQLHEDVGINVFRHEDGRVNYYRDQSQLVGCYLPDTKRYVHIESGKEDPTAVLLDGAIYTTGSKPAFRIDEGFDPVFAGCILFFFLGY